MRSVLDFLRARLATPALRFHAAMTVMMALVMLGLASTEQLTGLIGKLTALTTVAGPLLLLLTKGPATAPEEVASVLTDVLTNRPEAVRLRTALEGLEHALEYPPAVEVDLDAVRGSMDALGIRRKA